MTDPEVRILDQRTAQDRDRAFLPGMSRSWLMPMYDVFSRLIGARALHQRVSELAQVAPGESLVDVGCGTGNLSFAVLTAQPAARVTGLDPDGAALRRAARKARRRRVPLTLVRGYADRLPADKGTLDHVVSALALHHVDDEGRVAFAQDAFRALRPGGRVTIVDFGAPAAAVEGAGHSHDHGHGQGHALRHLPAILRGRRGRDRSAARHAGGDLLALLADAGFEHVREVDHVDHRLGRVDFVQATRP